ncbi:aldo/keto reductase [Pedosphaera parvula]|uniref:Aldo/keto reductase n=1 Tax=Pedosphaera parvula (strain Ellin514) TaxID=320771 RepID=B9XJZ2_PEDPL|nr:aldo/keto reductase [Pedosphaera parvula]EEF59815.1 aldo/keto reductase [Pedosphaera parvula Ellin514]
MNYKLFGKSGLRVSEICLGTMTFGEEWGWGSSKDESRAIFDLYVAAGGNFIDTADGYTNGSSERMVGEFVGAQRDRFVIGTKYSFNSNPGDPNAGGNHRKNMVRALEGSLKRLGTDYVDVYWLHAWDSLTPVEEVMRAMDDLVRAGKILYAGVSNMPAWLISQANTLATLRGWTPFVGLQIEYSLIERTPERELLPMAKALDIGVTAWSPLASGLLSGKYTKKSGNGEEKRLDKANFTKLDERNLSIAKAVQEIADEINRSPAQVAINWVRQRYNTIPIIGARKVSQVKDNLACLDFILPDNIMKKLDDVSRIELGYPHDFLTRQAVSDFLHGGTLGQIHNHRA